ncbi:PDZ domain-containing protein [Akkermansia sp. N21169]|uniref:PDZ domain-containing protein n=1 Tax=Akkermansia sp. N21169 TaxID=3040765 RepID=UPI00244E6E3E|nr:PDZ domain-containing protein [Akkermansia sp. N21169]MDH3068954.1 PDZ domain-containing protein [Akkermansia sp. N21169]
MRHIFTIALGLLCAQSVAFATNRSFRLTCTGEHEQPSVISTNVVLIQKDIAAALISRKEDLALQMACEFSISPQDRQEETIPCDLLSNRSRLGLTLFRLSSPPPGDQIVKTTSSSDLKRGDAVVFYDKEGNEIDGVYIGEEHYHSGISFIIPLCRVQFPTGQIRPDRGQACFTPQGTFVGFVMTSLSHDTGSYYLLPAQFVSFFAQHPAADRIRLGCQMDVNCCTPEVVQVTPGGPMDKAGVRPGDIIISFNGKSINKYKDFLNAIHYIGDDKPISIKVIRGTKILTIDNIVPDIQRIKR